MKKYLSVLIASFCLGATLPTHAQFRAIPASVTDSFKLRYPGATNVAWIDKITDFEATFIANDSSHLDARFSTNGHWKNTEKQIPPDQLPAAVKTGLSMGEFSAWPITSAYILYQPETNRRYHVTVAKNDIDKRNLLFNIKGRFLQDKFTL